MAASMDVPCVGDYKYPIESDSSSDNDSTGDNDSDDWNEEEMCVAAPSLCLLCSSTFPSADQVILHCDSDHGTQLSKFLARSDVDYYAFMKFVNYVRKHKLQYNELNDIAEKIHSLDESYLIPFDAEDALLQLDFDNYQEKLQSKLVPGSEAQMVELSQQDYDKLLASASEAAKLRRQLDDLHERYTSEISHLRLAMQNLLFSQTKSSVEQAASFGKIAQLSESEDESYISSYSHFSIHQEMLQDSIRTNSYGEAILNNAKTFEGKVVLDVGCGTGILSMFAAKAGASKVISVDMSDIIHQAMDIVRENGLEKVITLVKGKIEEISLPVDYVDIIISEWMGYFLLFESMLDSVIFARNKWLTNGGLVWPNRCDVMLCGSNDEELYRKNIGYWDDVYGFKMSCMRTEVLQEGNVQVAKKECIVTQSCCLKTLDCCTAQVEDLDFSASFTLKVSKTTTMYAVIGYFDTYFDAKSCTEKVTFSTGPLSKYTHWKQTVFLLHKPMAVKEGECVNGSMTCTKDEKDPRSLIITINIDKACYKYRMS